MKFNRSHSAPVGTALTVQTQDSKVAQAARKFGLTAKETAALTVVLTGLGMSNFAQAAEGATFALDVTSIITAIGVIVAAVTSVGLGAMSVVLVTKAFKYVKTAF